jgi:hypothetical protein
MKKKTEDPLRTLDKIEISREPGNKILSTCFIAFMIIFGFCIVIIAVLVTFHSHAGK